MRSVTYTVDDYEHSGDLQHAINDIRHICPEATNFHAWEEEDREAMSDYENEYGECDEPIMQGYVTFDVPEKCLPKLQEYGYC